MPGSRELPSVTVISTTISDELVLHTVTGVIGLEDITGSMQQWYSSNQFDPQKPILWDMREAGVDLPQPQVDEWSERNAAIIDATRAGQKTAWVFGDSQLAEMAVDLLGAREWSHRVRIFNNDLEAARAWLMSTIH